LEASALQGRWQVEHDDVRRMMREDHGEIVPAHRTRPGFKKHLDPDFFRALAVRHDFGSVGNSTTGSITR
jgi:hypothetical protein